MADGTNSTAVLRPVREINGIYFNKPKKLTVQEMVQSAIIAFSKKKGAPLTAIKKYMLGTYLYDVVKKRIYIQKFLKAAVADGRLIKSKGKGSALYKIRFVGSSRNCKKRVRKTVVKKPSSLKQKSKK